METRNGDQVISPDNIESFKTPLKTRIAFIAAARGMLATGISTHNSHSNAFFGRIRNSVVMFLISTIVFAYLSATSLRWESDETLSGNVVALTEHKHDKAIDHMKLSNGTDIRTARNWRRKITCRKAKIHRMITQNVIIIDDQCFDGWYGEPKQEQNLGRLAVRPSQWPTIIFN